MKAQSPAYVIKYIECAEPGHDGEKVNLICLNRECSEASLICSLCGTQRHKGHSFKPLKIYLEELYSRYRSGQGRYGAQLEELEKRKTMLLLHLRSCVERLAEEFARLQEDILFTCQSIRTQIQENEARRSRFEEFYLSMVRDNYGDPKFEVRNYLFKEQIQTLTDQDIFQEMTKSVAKQINDLRGSFLHQPDAPVFSSPPQTQILPTSFKIPPSVICQGDIFTQTKVNNAQNLCLFDLEVAKWANKLRVTVLTVGSRVVLGVMKREEFQKADFRFLETINCQYLDSTGKSKGAQSNNIAALANSTIIDFYVKKNNLRAVSISKTAIFNLADKNTCFFFVLEGQAKVKITYPYVK